MQDNIANNNTPEQQNNISSENDFWVECNVCKTQLKNWTGSTPCCGSIAYLVENGKATKNISLFASTNGEPILPVIVNMESKTTH